MTTANITGQHIAARLQAVREAAMMPANVLALRDLQQTLELVVKDAEEQIARISAAMDPDRDVVVDEYFSHEGRAEMKKAADAAQAAVATCRDAVDEAIIDFEDCDEF